MTTLTIERRIELLLDRKLQRRASGPYSARTNAEVEAALHRLFSAHGLEAVVIDDLRRMTGGASKEQFSFMLAHAGGPPRRMVLRMDPLESVVETCRGREAEILRAVRADVPVPESVVRRRRR